MRPISPARAFLWREATITCTGSSSRTASSDSIISVTVSMTAPCSIIRRQKRSCHRWKANIRKGTSTTPHPHSMAPSAIYTWRWIPFRKRWNTGDYQVVPQAPACQVRRHIVRRRRGGSYPERRDLKKIRRQNAAGSSVIFQDQNPPGKPPPGNPPPGKPPPGGIIPPPGMPPPKPRCMAA